MSGVRTTFVSSWVWTSMKPGERVNPVASTVCSARIAAPGPTRTIVPSEIATSATNGAAPVPSITEACRINVWQVSIAPQSYGHGDRLPTHRRARVANHDRCGACCSVVFHRGTGRPNSNPKAINDAPVSDREHAARTRAGFTARPFDARLLRSGAGQRAERGPRLRGDRGRDAHADSFDRRDPRLRGMSRDGPCDPGEPVDAPRCALRRRTRRTRRDLGADARRAT